MPWLNGYGALAVALLLVPNVIFAMTHRDGFENRYHNRAVEVLEQVGRFGSFLLMIIWPPVVCRGFWFAAGKTVWLVAGGALVLLYLVFWAIFWKEDSVRKSVWLSVLPSLLFLLTGVLAAHGPLLAAAVLFAPCHILLSVQNARQLRRETQSGNEK